MIDLISTIRNAHEKGTSLKRSLMDLRQKYGGISDSMMDAVKDVYHCTDDELAEITRWFPKLKSGPLSAHQLTVCEPCWKSHPELMERLKEIQKRCGDEVLQITPSGCLGACGVGPNALLDGQLYSQLDHNRPFWDRLESFIQK
jgi:NADH:ubiquinone oxidoreductase subunit E